MVNIEYVIPNLKCYKKRYYQSITDVVLMYMYPLFNMVKLRSLVDASTFLSVTDTCLSFCLQVNGQIYSLYGS